MTITGEFQSPNFSPVGLAAPGRLTLGPAPSNFQLVRAETIIFGADFLLTLNCFSLWYIPTSLADRCETICLLILHSKSCVHKPIDYSCKRPEFQGFSYRTNWLQLVWHSALVISSRPTVARLLTRPMCVSGWYPIQASAGLAAVKIALQTSVGFNHQSQTAGCHPG